MWMLFKSYLLLCFWWVLELCWTVAVGDADDGSIDGDLQTETTTHVKRKTSVKTKKRPVRRESGKEMKTSENEKVHNYSTFSLDCTFLVTSVNGIPGV